MNRPKPLSASGVAAGLYVGAQSDDGATGNAGTFANMAVSRISLHGRQPSSAEISQMMHGMKMHGIRTAHAGRIRHLGVTVSPDMGAAYNLGQWSEPVERADPNTVNRDYIISRAASLNSDSGVICSSTSTAGLQFAPPNLTRLVGAGFGGEAQAALCPAPRTINGTHYLIYSRHDFGTSLALAKSTNIDPAAASYAKQFNLTTPGYAGGFGNKDFWPDPDGVTVRFLLEGTPAWTFYAGTLDLATGILTLDLTPLRNGFVTGPAGDASGPDVTIGLGDDRIHVLFHSGYQSAVYHTDGYSLKAMRWSPYDMVFDFIPGMLAAYSLGQHQTQAADASMREKILPLTGVKVTRFVHAASTGGGSGISAVVTSEADYGITDLFKPSVRSEFVPSAPVPTDPVSIRQQIADSILAGLQSLSSGNGDAVTPNVQAMSSSGVIPANFTVALIEEESIAEDSTSALMAVYWRTTWQAQVSVQEPGADQSRTVRLIEAELRKVIENPDNSSTGQNTWGGLVKETLLIRVEIYDAGADKGSVDGIAIWFSTLHGEQLGNPYLLRV